MIGHHCIRLSEARIARNVQPRKHFASSSPLQETDQIKLKTDGDIHSDTFQKFTSQDQLDGSNEFDLD